MCVCLCMSESIQDEIVKKKRLVSLISDTTDRPTSNNYVYKLRPIRRYCMDTSTAKLTS